MILRRLSVCCSPDGRGLMMNPIGLFRSGSSMHASGSCCKCLQLRVKKPLPDLQAKFEFYHGDYEKQCLHALSRKDKAGTVMNNPSQSVFLFMDRQHLQVSVESSWNHRTGSIDQSPWRSPNVFLADSENQGYSFQVVQPLPLPAPGSADLLGCGRHRGSPPSIHAWLGLPVQLSHMGKAFPLPPAETFRSKVMSSSPPVLLHKDLNLCSDITCFCPPLPALGLIQFHPCVLSPPPLP